MRRKRVAGPVETVVLMALLLMFFWGIVYLIVADLIRAAY